ncbi:hypothetical protein BGZ73_004173 [Actinomortierella ambigua]|nr:hypothetical protein BGZ73_004173 [Actinomortierella ambigua]
MVKASRNYRIQPQRPAIFEVISSNDPAALLALLYPKAKTSPAAAAAPTPAPTATTLFSRTSCPPAIIPPQSMPLPVTAMPIMAPSKWEKPDS